MRIGRVGFDPESGLTTQVRGINYHDHKEMRTHVRRKYTERLV